MQKQIELLGRQLEYELQRKKVKNINLRIKPEGVFVSAPKAVAQRLIDAFLISRAEFIFAAMDRVATKDMPDYRDGSKFSLLGKDYVLKVSEAEKNSVHISENYIIVELKDEELIRKSLDKLLRELAEQTVTSLCQKLCHQMCKEMPIIKYRAMKSRWGSCTPKKNQICINTRLMTAPEECVEFVIAHELCHFLRADHSAKFYEELHKLMPDWKQRKKLLTAYGKYLQ